MPPLTRTMAGRRPASPPSDAPGIAPPDVLVDLELEPRRQIVLDHPAREILRIERAVRGGQQDGRPRGNPPLTDDGAGELVVAPIDEDELHLVAAPDPGHRLPIHRSRHPAPRRLDVEDHAGAGIDVARREAPAGLDLDLVAVVEEAPDQRVHGALRERLAAGHRHEADPPARDLRGDVFEVPLLPAVKGVGGVAVDASKVAPGQPDEGARPTGLGGLALQARENLVDHQPVAHRRGVFFAAGFFAAGLAGLFRVAAAGGGATIRDFGSTGFGLPICARRSVRLITSSARSSPFGVSSTIGAPSNLGSLRRHQKAVTPSAPWPMCSCRSRRHPRPFFESLRWKARIHGTPISRSNSSITAWYPRSVLMS